MACLPRGGSDRIGCRFGLALQTDGGAIFGSGLFFLGVAWAATTSLAYAAIRKCLIDQHREWIIRSYVVTFAFVTFRAGQVALVGRGVELATAIGIMAWACWAIPLLATELILQARKIAAVRAESPPLTDVELTQLCRESAGQVCTP